MAKKNINNLTYKNKKNDKIPTKITQQLFIQKSKILVPCMQTSKKLND